QSPTHVQVPVHRTVALGPSAQEGPCSEANEVSRWSLEGVHVLDDALEVEDVVAWDKDASCVVLDGATIVCCQLPIRTGFVLHLGGEPRREIRRLHVLVDRA